MKARFLVAVGFVLAVMPAFAQTIDSSVHVNQFPGSTVAQKLTNAMATCTMAPAVPCILVLDPSMATVPAGVSPPLCANCYLVDYRNGPPFGSGGVIVGSNLPISVTANAYGAKGDCIHDDAPAFQSAIDAASFVSNSVYVPPVNFGSCYLLNENLYFYYDAVHNPGFNSTAANLSNDFLFFGIGAYESTANGTYKGRSYIKFTNAIGPSMALANPSGDYTQRVELAGLTLDATNTTEVILAGNPTVGTGGASGSFTSFSKLHDLTIFQRGTGGGIFLHNVWSNSQVQDVDIRSFQSTPYTGSIGLRVCNDTGGGLVEVNRVWTFDFDHGQDWGGHAYGICDNWITASSIKDSDVSSNNSGLYIGRGFSGSIENLYGESDQVQSLWIGDQNQGGITITGGQLTGTSTTNTAGMIVINQPETGGSYPAGQWSIVGVTIQGTQLRGIGTSGINIIDPYGFSTGTITNVAMNNFGGGSSVYCIADPNGIGGWSVTNPNCNGGGATLFQHSGPTWVGSYLNGATVAIANTNTNYVNGVLLASWGQKTNVTSSRTLGTIYSAPSNYALEVEVSFDTLSASGCTGANEYITGFVGATSGTLAAGPESGGFNSCQVLGSISFVVPAGYSYKVTYTETSGGPASPSNFTWYETGLN